MAKPKNAEAESKIIASAMKSLLDVGYNKTTYQAISNATGYSRTYIQHYLPKKEMLLDVFYERLLAAADDAVARLRNAEDVNVSMFLSGQVYFSFMSCRRARPLALDVLESRRLTETTILLNEVYERSRTGTQKTELVENGLTRVLGGAYENVYRKLTTNKPVDAVDEALHVVKGYLDLVGQWSDETRKACLEQRFTNKEIASIIRGIVRQIEH